MHGGTNKGAPQGNRNAQVHGNRSAEAERQLKEVRQVNRDLRILAKVRDGVELRAGEKLRLLALQREARSLMLDQENWECS
jgi:hypothetical protein